MATFPPGQLDPRQPQRKPPNAPDAVAFSPNQMDPREQFEDGSGPVAEGEAAKRAMPDPGNGIVIDPDDLDIHDGGPYDDKSGEEPDEYQAKAAPARPQLAVVNQPTPRPQLVSDKTPPPEPLDPELLKAMRERLGPSLETEYKATVAKREEAAGLSELQERARALGIEIAPETPEGEKPDAETGFKIDDDDSAVMRSLKQAYNTVEPFLSGVGTVASQFGTMITKDPANIVLGGPLRGYREALNYLTEGRNAIRNWVKSQIGEERFAEIEKQSADEMAKTLSPLYMKELQKVQGQLDSGEKKIGDLAIERSGIPGVETVMADAESVPGKMAQSIMQFMTFYLAMKPATFVGALGAGAVADFAAFKAADGNFANLIQMLPGMEKNALLEYLATDETTPETEGRLKNALTGALGGIIAEAVFMYARGYKERRKAQQLAGVETDEDFIKRATREVRVNDSLENPKIADEDLGKRTSELLGGEPGDLPVRLQRKLQPVHFDVPTQIVAKSLAGDIPRIPPPQPGFKRVWSASEANIADRAESFAPVVRGYYDTPEEATRAAGIEKFEPSRELTYVDIPEADYSRVRQRQIEAGYGPSMVGRTFTAGFAIRVRAFQENRLPSWVNQDGKAPAVADPNFKSAGDLETAKKPTRPEADQETPIEAAGPARVGAPPPLPEVIESSVFNFNRVDLADEPRKVLRDMAEAFQSDYDVSKGVRTFKQIEKESNGFDPVNVLLKERKDGLPSDAEVYALRRLHATSAEKLRELAQAALEGGPAEEFAFMRMVQIHRLVQREVKNIGTAYARGLAQFRMTAGSGKAQALQIEQMLDRVGGSASAKRMAAEINLAAKEADKDPRAQIIMDDAVRRVGDFMSKRKITADIVAEYWRNAILSGPKTHLVNAISNSAVIQYSIFERAIAGKIGDILSPVDGIKLQEAAIMGHAQKMALKELFSALWRNSLRVARLKKIADDEPSLFAKYSEEYNKVEQPYSRALSSDNYSSIDANSFAGKALDAFGAFINAPGSALGGADVLFKFVNERMQLHALALRQAMEELERGTISQKDVKGRIADLIQNPPDDIKIQARNFAQLNTFTNTPGNVTKKILAAREAVDRMTTNAIGVRVGTFVLPFVNTPANILNYTFERTPLAPFMTRWRNAVAAGGAERDLALAKLSIGSTIALVGFDMAMDGHITGSGPGDFNEMRNLRRSGWQPNSLRFQVGEHPDGRPIYRYFAINRTDPIGTWLLMSAEAAEIARASGGELDEQFFENMARTSAGIAATFMDKTMLTGLSRVIDTLNNPDRYAMAWASSQAGSFVPAIAAEIARVNDPIMRNAWGPWEKMRSRTPGLSKDVPPRLDYWGRPIKYTSGIGQWYDTLSPIYSSTTEKAQPADRVMKELNYFPPQPRTVNMGRGKSVPLRYHPETANQWITLRSATKASELLRNNMQDMKPSEVRHLSKYGDDTLLETLNKVVTGKHPTLSTEFMLETDPERKKTQLSQIIRHYNAAAKAQVIRENPWIKEAADKMKSRAERATEAPY
jgi:hypothetical protein